MVHFTKNINRFLPIGQTTNISVKQFPYSSYQQQQPVYSINLRRFCTSENTKSHDNNCSNKILDTANLFSAISELNKFNIRLRSFPVITVVGPQSSGKTSLIEAICGKSLFPKGMGMSTMKPFYITTIRSNNTKIKVGNKELTSEEDAQDEIERVNRNELIKAIDIYLESPNVYNNYLTDLPGLFVVADKNDKELPRLIRKVNTEHLSNPNSIPVVVHAAPSDPATNSAIQMVNKLDREQDSFGIITKIDMIEKQKNEQLINMLNGKQYPLGYGYCCVILRSDIEIESGISLEDKMKEEEQFKIKNPYIKPFGIEEMKRRLSYIQFQKIRGIIPQLISDIDKEISKCEGSESFLELLTNNNSNSKLTTRLKIMIEKLVGSSIERCEFEDKLKKSLEEVIHDYIEKTFRRENKDDYIPVLSKYYIDSSISSFHSRNHSNPCMYKIDSFKDLFCFGLLSPTTTDNNSVRKALDNESSLSCALPLFDFVIDDPLGKKRLQWNNYLKNYFNSLLANDNIQNMVNQITVDELTKYIQNDPESNDEITKQFAEYMVKEIGNEAYESKIKYSISAMINIEKRPLISLVEVARHLTQIYQNIFTFHGGFFEGITKNNQKLSVEIYSEPWNEAYLKAVADKLVENCYRNVAVNLLDRMVERLLEMTVDMINKKNAEKEKNKVSDKINKLNELRRTISKYIDN